MPNSLLETLNMFKAANSACIEPIELYTRALLDSNANHEERANNLKQAKAWISVYLKALTDLQTALEPVATSSEKMTACTPQKPLNIPLNTMNGIESLERYSQYRGETIKRNERLDHFGVNLEILGNIPFIYECILEASDTQHQLQTAVETMAELQKAYTRYTEAQYQVLFDEIKHTQEEGR